jgi:hypothetical protein
MMILAFGITPVVQPSIAGTMRRRYADELTPAEQHQLDILKAQMARGLSKNQRLTELCRKIDAHDGCGG